MSDLLSNLAYLHGRPEANAFFKAKNEHFVVKEVLGFPFSGQGEHLMVRIRKNGENTSFVANELARVCGVKSKDVGWAGLKDRHAVTEQWLSIHLPKGDMPDFTEFLAQYPSIEILQTDWHNKKLRPGDLQGNEFEIVLSEITDVDSVIAKLELVKRFGVPNYFGQQRFGRDGNNVDEARRWGRDNVRTRNQNKRSLYLSAARSWIFNHIVSQRLTSGLFDDVLVGDVIETNGQQSLVTQDVLATLPLDSANNTAALAGDNALPTSGKPLEIEQAVIDSEADLMALIRGNRMRHDRRNMRLKIDSLSWQSSDDELVIKFALDAGSFATAIIREVVNAKEVERQF
jgi:tRNA pseudouridine13 synthase